MTTRSSNTSDAPYAAPAQVPSHGPARRDATAPYVQPASIAVDAVLIDASRASAGPYVPAPWRLATDKRTESGANAPSASATLDPSAVFASDASVSDAGPSTELPWIDAFLDVETSADVSSDLSADAAEPMPVADDSTAEPIRAGEEWPLDEAGAALRALAEGIAADQPTPDAPHTPSVSEAVAPSQPVESLPMWADDDLMDIMPVKSEASSTSSGDHWAAQARQEAADDGSAAAATALETVARRLRDGDLTLPGYKSDTGEAAALAAALAAILGERRG